MMGAILAGGRGKRLGPLTRNLPKPIVKIAGKPLLEHQIKLFRSCNIKKIILCLHYLPEKIIKHFGDGKKFGVKIKYSIEKEPMGTAGALKNAEKLLDDAFIVMYGDNFTNISLKKLERFHKRKKAVATIALCRRPASQKTSSMVLADKNLRIKKFIERPKESDSRLIKGRYKYVNAGIYVLEPQILKLIPKKRFDFGHELFPLLLKKKLKLVGYCLPKGTYLKEIGTIEKLKAVREYAKTKIKSSIS